MPRAQQSEAGRIVGFFRKADLPTAELILGLCRDEVAERQAKSSAAKRRAATPAAPVQAAEPVAPVAAVARKKGKAKKAKGARKRTQPAAQAATGEVEPQLPMGEGEGYEIDPNADPETAEAGDLVTS